LVEMHRGIQLGVTKYTVVKVDPAYIENVME